MSVIELKKAVDTLSLEDRLDLADYLRQRSHESDL
jgi:predicted chitinase